MKAEQDFVQRLADENRRFYSTLDGRGSLRALELTFEHRWTYLFELVQNAIDAGAKQIEIQLNAGGDYLVFQHDGTAPLREEDVQGLAKIFRSSKGAASVGFMGIGFKSVFGRFRRASVSGWGWKFRYEIETLVGGKFGDVQPDLLGAVIPIWDDSILDPDPRFTTRFELSGLMDANVNLSTDLECFLPEQDRTPLAILAWAGLRQLRVDGQEWELGISDESSGALEVTAISSDCDLLWRLFPVKFQPSRVAIARFLEHRRIQPEEHERERVYSEASRERWVLGVLPLDDHGHPNPPSRGRVYATLPTEATLPIGLHVHADWLLNISRTGLREIEDNPWQRDIVDRIADVVGSFLQWVAGACRDRESGSAAFAALRQANADTGNRLEALLASGRWKERLRSKIEDAAVLPAWTEDLIQLRYVKPIEVIVPPAELAEAISEEPTLNPAVLLRGPVLAQEILGLGARELLADIGVLPEMPSLDLERVWTAGLEFWWNSLPENEVTRRDLLFRLWGAVAKLSRRPGWKEAVLPCLRTVGGDWLPVHQARYFSEALPSDREPGGPQTRAFLKKSLPDVARCLPDGWLGALRQAAGIEQGLGPFGRARFWLENRAGSIELRDAIDRAMTAMAGSENPDWTVLISLGHWTKHRNRPDLLRHVLTKAESVAIVTRVSDALLSVPYVERGAARERLFPDLAVISPAYVEEDPTGIDAHEWRTFFERAGASGGLVVVPIERRAARWERQAAADFLGVTRDQVGESNDNGYTLLDFEIPGLPLTEAPEAIRRALAPWLEDGYGALRDRGRRKATYSYYGSQQRRGLQPSVWVEALTSLEWVPCTDDVLRRPSDVLAEPDPARDDAPVAELSRELSTTLAQEGVIFGSRIPSAPAIRKLLKLGSTLGAEPLAQLLREVRQAVADNEDRARYTAAIPDLTLPTREGNRVPIRRLVRRAGGRFRGALGGWIVPLERLSDQLRAEIEQPGLPYEIPDATTGAQVLEFLKEVWSRARFGEERLANEVRDVLPLAYAYCLEDVETDGELANRWRQALGSAAVFAEREWIPLSDSDRRVYFDDLEDRRFLAPHTTLTIATSGQLGNDRGQQERTARALGLPFLSDTAKITWEESSPQPVGEWQDRFDLMCQLLRAARGPGRDQTDEQQRGVEVHTYRLRRVSELKLGVLAGEEPLRTVPINARLEANALTVAGAPTAFAADAAAEMTRAFSFGQRANLAAHLAGLFAAIDDDRYFALGIEKFVRSFAPDFRTPKHLEQKLEDRETVRPTTTEPEKEAPSAPFVPPDGSAPEKKPTDDQIGTRPLPQDDELWKDVQSGPFTRERALARIEALQEELKKALKGEIEPEEGDTPSGTVERETGHGPGELLGDETYREAAAAYERSRGREATVGDSRQIGWDVASLDPLSGKRRLIEVKGRGRPWEDAEIVELSRAQVMKAFEALRAGSDGEWWLYVVERTPSGSYHVLPIENPIHTAGKWILRGAGWRTLASDPSEVQLGG